MHVSFFPVFAEGCGRCADAEALPGDPALDAGAEPYNSIRWHFAACGNPCHLDFKQYSVLSCYGAVQLACLAQQALNHTAAANPARPSSPHPGWLPEWCKTSLTPTHSAGSVQAWQSDGLILWPVLHHSISKQQVANTDTRGQQCWHHTQAPHFRFARPEL
jgi:hypothetical protein